jgi:hypothetical protein
VARLRRATGLVDAYGIRQFLADIEAGREYWREPGAGLIHSDFDWIVTEAFEAFFAQYVPDWPFPTARDYRERNTVELLKAMRSGG